jgi:spore coat protein U-like protein
MSHAHYHLKLIALAKTLAVASQQRQNAVKILIARMSVPVALPHAQNNLRSSISHISHINFTSHINIISIIHQTDARHVACQTSAPTLHTTTAMAATTPSQQHIQHGMDICTHLICP